MTLEGATNNPKQRAQNREHFVETLVWAFICLQLLVWYQEHEKGEPMLDNGSNQKSVWETLWWFHALWVVFTASFVVCQGMD